MKHSRKIAFIFTALASGVSIAQSGATRSGPEFVITPSPAASQYLSGVELRPQEQNGIAYLCGGVGSDEQAQMKSAASKYDVMMTFSAANGAYLADVDVDIADNKGQSVFSASCDAPILLVDLPKSGNYKLSAEAEGKKITRNTRISEKGSVKRIAMTWPTKTVDMGLTPDMRAGSEERGMRSSGNSGRAETSGGMDSGAGSRSGAGMR